MEISKHIDDDIAINKLTQNVRKNSPLFFRRPLKHVGRKCIASWQIIWLTALSNHPQPSHEVIHASPDGIFNYTSAILSYGLLLMELRDTIHEGDGERILRCYKFMLPYFFATGHNKYALEAFHLLAHVHAAASPRPAHQIMWSRTVNMQGQQGYNIPVNLQNGTSQPLP